MKAKLFLTAIPVAAGLAFGQPGQVVQAQNDACSDKRTITVNGAATVMALPDIAVVSFGISANAKTSKEALASLKSAALTLRGNLQGAGIASVDIATNDFSVIPVLQDYTANRQSITADGKREFAYAVNNRVDVTVRDLKRMSEVIDIGFSAGSNALLGVQLQTSNIRLHRDEARKLAVKAAAEKAALLATASGNAKVGCVLKINEIKTYEYWWNPGGNQSQNVVQAASGGDRDSYDDSPVAPGAIRVRAEVELVYALGE